MHPDRTNEALELISLILKWEVGRDRKMNTGIDTLRSGMNGHDVIWTVTPKIGGPVRILHPIYNLGMASIDTLAEVACQLASISNEVERNNGERADYENETRKAARSLLRSKSAAGIRLVDVVSEIIPTDRYHNIGLEVTFEWGPENATRRRTMEIGNQADLFEQFDKLVEDVGLERFRRAA
jgi:hypothetical protein